jgi:hypothetical protein
VRRGHPGGGGAVAPDDPALLLYSAGFADEIHGVRHDHAGVVAAAASFATSYLGLTAGQRVFAVARLSSAFGLGAGLLFPLLAGARALLLPEQPQSRTLLAAIAAFAPDYFLTTPSIYGQLARDVVAAGVAPPLAGVKRAIAGGEGMPDKLIPRIRAALGVEVEVGYGITEVLQLALAGIAADDARPGACGRPLAGIEARVVDDDGRPVGPDEIGTLQVRAPSMCTGYWTGIATPAVDLDGWLTTRDRFLVDGRGVYHHCGRTDDLFKVGGKWVAPGEVERALVSHDAVWEAAVIGVDDEDGLLKPLAFVVVNVGHARRRRARGRAARVRQGDAGAVQVPAVDRVRRRAAARAGRATPALQAARAAPAAPGRDRHGVTATRSPRPWLTPPRAGGREATLARLAQDLTRRRPGRSSTPTAAARRAAVAARARRAGSAATRAGSRPRCADLDAGRAGDRRRGPARSAGALAGASADLGHLAAMPRAGTRRGRPRAELPRLTGAGPGADAERRSAAASSPTPSAARPAAELEQAAVAAAPAVGRRAGRRGRGGAGRSGAAAAGRARQPTQRRGADRAA